MHLPWLDQGPETGDLPALVRSPPGTQGLAIVLQDVADMKKEITDEDLLALITDEVNQPPQLWALVDLQVGCNTQTQELLHTCMRMAKLMQHSRWRFSNFLRSNRSCQGMRPAPHLPGTRQLSQAKGPVSAHLRHDH